LTAVTSKLNYSCKTLGQRETDRKRQRERMGETDRETEREKEVEIKTDYIN